MTHSFSHRMSLLILKYKDLIKIVLTSQSAEDEITNVCGPEKYYLTLG